MMFIIPLSEWSSSLSNVFLPAIWTCELINTSSVKFIDLARVLYAKIFSMVFLVFMLF